MPLFIFMCDENWLPVIGYEGLYWVSDLGRIKSKSKVLSGALNHDGYVVIGMRKASKTKLYRLHRIVAFAFIPNPDGLPQVNHKDLNKKNNKIDNLEWCTNKQNTMHAIKNGKQGGRKSKPVHCIGINGEIIYTYKHAGEAGRILGIDYSNIHSAIKGGKRQKAGGYYWKFA